MEKILGKKGYFIFTWIMFTLGVCVFFIFVFEEVTEETKIKFLYLFISIYIGVKIAEKLKEY